MQCSPCQNHTKYFTYPIKYGKLGQSLWKLASEGRAKIYVSLLYSTINCSENHYKVIAHIKTNVDKLRKVTN